MEIMKIIDEISKLPPGTGIRAALSSSKKKEQEEAFVVRLGPMPAFANEVKSS